MSNHIIRMFYDLETTGLDAELCGVHQIAGIIEMDSEVLGTFNLRIAPFKGARYEPGAMALCQETEQDMAKFQSEEEAYGKLLKLCSSYIHRAISGKVLLVGYNNSRFDDRFLRSFFKRMKVSVPDVWKDYYTVFEYPSEDVYVQDVKPANLPIANNKLGTVAKHLGLLDESDSSKLHEANFDIELTRRIWHHFRDKKPEAKPVIKAVPVVVAPKNLMGYTDPEEVDYIISNEN